MIANNDQIKKVDAGGVILLVNIHTIICSYDLLLNISILHLPYDRGELEEVHFYLRCNNHVDQVLKLTIGEIHTKSHHCS